jgi:hypothetical protein
MSTSTASTKGMAPMSPALGLRRLRLITSGLTLVFAILVPFEFGVLAPPDLSMINLSGLPVVGQYFPQPLPAVENSLRTAELGKVQNIVVRVPKLPNTLLALVIRYPNGHTVRVPMQTDAQGTAAYQLRVTYVPHQFREVVHLKVVDATGRQLAFTQFAVQQSKPPAQTAMPSNMKMPGQKGASTHAHSGQH